MLTKAAPNATEFYRHYKHSVNNTKITSNSNEGNGYVNTGTLGYMCTNEGQAQDYEVENDATPLYHYRSSEFDEIASKLPSGLIFSSLTVKFKDKS